MTDWELLQSYVHARSQSAFAELVSRHSGWIRAAARRQVRDPHLADDVTQAVFLALAQQAHRLHRGAAVSTWLFQVTRFASTAALRSEARRKRREREAGGMMFNADRSATTDDALSETQWQQVAPKLDACVARLREADHRAVLLRFYEQKSYPDIAALLGVSEEAARKRTDRAVEKLREMIARQATPISAAVLSAGMFVRTADAAPLAMSLNVSPHVLSITKGALNMMKLATFSAPVAAGLVALMLLAVGVVFLRADSPTSKSATPVATTHPGALITGADQTDKYLPHLKDKSVAMVVNPTSTIGGKPSIDVLLAAGVRVAEIFGPEHGFRGNASNGTPVADEIDRETGIPIISLYGSKRKPSAQDMSDIDVLIYDMQDMGVRFYTKINTLRDVMDACAENDKELLLLDRPNPHGYMIDGSMLETQFKSGIGQFPVPIAHGMTLGEFAQMINGEGWLLNAAGKKCNLNVIKLANYNHDMPYVLPVRPSPNLNTEQAVMLYPSTCLFEGTILNHGRGTQMPFTVIGAPALKGKYEFSYTPVGILGMAEDPVHQDEVCYGLDLRKYDVEQLRRSRRINLGWIKELYAAYPDKQKFFDQSFHPQIGNFDRIAGTKALREQIIAGVSEEEIRKSWEPGLTAFKAMREKYLLYP